MSKFFNRNWKAGFTLVELIVVIAILAILAGIAIPVYSGYIKKANEAADNTLLGAVNTAFAAASFEGGQYSGHPGSAKAELTAEGAVDSVKSPVDSDGALFANYYSGNENSTFKVFTKLFYNSTDGVFVGLTGGEDSTDLGGGWTVTTYNGPDGKVLSYSNGTVSVDVNENDKKAVEGSTFGDKNVITMEDMMGEINGVVNLAVGMLSSGGGNTAAMLAQVTEDEGFKAFMTSIGATEADLADNTKMMNALVLYAATNTESVNTDAMMTALKSAGSNAGQVLQAAVVGGNNETASVLSSAAMIYGLATSYAYKNNINGSDALQTMMAAISDPGWTDYLNSPQATADLAGYSGAMGMISDNVSNLDTDSLLSDGFASNDILTMLNTVFGQGSN